MRPQDHYQAGSLQQAVQAAKEEVRKNPTDTGKRGFLAEMLCFAGDLEGADRQLDALGQQQPDAMMGIGLFRQLVRAEQARGQFFTEGRLPEFLAKPNEQLTLHLEASIRMREGHTTEAAALLVQAEEKRALLTGTSDDQPFTDFRDLDDMTAPLFEVWTTNGKYYWIPIERVDLVELRAPTRPRDLIWRRAHMVVNDGPDGEVYLPVLYHGTSADKDDKTRLGRATDWRSDAGVTRGIGQRTFLVGADGRTILELATLTFNKS